MILTESMKNMVTRPNYECWRWIWFVQKVPMMVALSKLWFHQSVSEIINKKFQKLCYQFFQDNLISNFYWSLPSANHFISLSPNFLAIKWKVLTKLMFCKHIIPFLIFHMVYNSSFRHIAFIFLKQKVLITWVIHEYIFFVKEMKHHKLNCHIQSQLSLYLF